MNRRATRTRSRVNETVIDASLRPRGRLGILSQSEIGKLLDTSQGGLYRLFRDCCLAVLNCGNESDDAKALLERYRSFKVEVVHDGRGIKLNLSGVPETAFVDGRIIAGIGEHLFSVLRDIVFVHAEFTRDSAHDLDSSRGVTDAVFHVLRNAGVMQPVTSLKMVICWGGHSVPRDEYEYSKEVGYQLGLRGLDICTGCGPGAMKGPMKGAAIGHSKQRIGDGRYLGVTEPGIIAAEAPNPIVNNLVIMPDIEKRLEAFVRVGHGIVVFPGGAGTMEEILYVLGLLLHPENRDAPLPLVLTGPRGSRDYFAMVHEFIGRALGAAAQRRYEIVIDDPVAVAKSVRAGIREVHGYRRKTGDAFYFDWRLTVPEVFQEPFAPTHENMSRLTLSRDLAPFSLAANLRRAFSGIVAGNVKRDGIRAVERRGAFEVRGDRRILEAMDELLAAFARQGRMKLPGSRYAPCYRVVT